MGSLTVCMMRKNKDGVDSKSVKDRKKEGRKEGKKEKRKGRKETKTKKLVKEVSEERDP